MEQYSRYYLQRREQVKEQVSLLWSVCYFIIVITIAKELEPLERRTLLRADSETTDLTHFSKATNCHNKCYC